MGLKKEELQIETSVPPFFRCPISLEVMSDPVSLCTGVTYERANIEKWLDSGNNVCPATMETLNSNELIPNHTLRRLIQEWCLSKGFDRIPTPKSPANPSKIRLIAQQICNTDDARAALEALKTLKIMARGSRNRKCMQAAGILKLLAQLIVSSDPHPQMVREAVGVMACFESLEDSSTRQILRGPRVLSFLESLLLDNEMEARMSAAILVELLSRDVSCAREIGSRAGIVSGIISLLREEEEEEAYETGTCALFNLCAVGRNRVRIAESGHSIDALTRIVVNGKEKKVRERALGVMEALSTTAEGRAAIEDNTLAVGGVVKSLLRVSPLADEYGVGIIWRLCLKSSEDDVLNESFFVGAFNKLLMFVQIDSASPATKAKANQLLKLLSPLRHAHYNNHAS